MNQEKRAYLQLHAAVALWGGTAIFGKLLSLSLLPLVWWRTFLACLVFLVGSRVWAEVRALPRADVNRFLGIGVLLMFHWLCFYGSIKLANASIGLICLGSVVVFSSILEPIFNRSPFKLYEILLSLFVLAGVWLIFLEIRKMEKTVGENVILGFWIGILGSFLGAMVTIFNKRMVERATPFAMSFLEMVGSWASLSILLPFVWGMSASPMQFLPSAMDWVYLPFFVILCTNLAQIFSFSALKHVSAFAANLTLNLEPVYGIIFAIIFLKENQQLTLDFYIGAAVVIGSVLIYPFLRNRLG